MKKIILIISIFFGFWIMAGVPVLAQVCQGTGYRGYTSWYCDYDGFSDTYSCRTNGIDGNSGACFANGGQCVFRVRTEDHCAGGGSSPCDWSNQCAGMNVCYDPAGCSWCYPSCNPACGQGDGCGGTCSNASDVDSYGACQGCGQQQRWRSNPCGGSGWTTNGCGCRECGPHGSATCGWYTLTYDCRASQTLCQECETCSPRCGQAMDCGGFCSNVDNGGPAAVTLNAPYNAGAGSPYVIPGGGNVANLSWVNNDGRTNYYQVAVIGPTNWSNNNVNGTSTNTPALSPGVYHWHVTPVNTTCNVDVGTQSADGYFRVDQAPTFNNNPPGGNFGLLNYLSQNVAIESTSQGYWGNQVCQPAFGGLPTNYKRVSLVVTANDPDGGGEIDTVTVRIVNRATGAVTASVTEDNIASAPVRSSTGSIAWTGLVNVGGVAGQNRTITFPVDLSSLPDAVYRFDVIVTDIYGVGSGVVNSNRNLKLWNCQVPVHGTLYDGSAGQGCPNIGFTNLVNSDFNFQTLTYNHVNTVADVNMTRIDDSSYGTNNVLWYGSYLPTFNIGISGIEGTSQQTRIIDLGLGGVTRACNTQIDVGASNPYTVDPYTNNPSLQIDFSWIANQNPWFQVVGGGAKAGRSIQNNVPITCFTNPGVCRAAMSIGTGAGAGDTNSGLLVALSGLEYNTGCPSCVAGFPNNWSKLGQNLMAENYLYQYFYREYYNKLGLGVTSTGAQSISSIGSTGVYFVNGDLTIDADRIVPQGQYLMVMVSGSIIISPNVNRVEGIYLADGNIFAGGSSDTQLAVNGMLYSANGNITLVRSYSVHSQNNTSPGTVVTYRPDFIFSMPIKVSQILSGWRLGY